MSVMLEFFTLAKNNTVSDEIVPFNIFFLFLKGLCHQISVPHSKSGVVPMSSLSGVG